MMTKKNSTKSLVFLLTITYSSCLFAGFLQSFVKVCGLLYLMYFTFFADKTCEFRVCEVNKMQGLKPLIAFILLILVGLFRSIQLDVISPFNVIFDATFIVLIFFYCSKLSTYGSDILDNLFFGIFLYLLLNIILFAVGFENPVSSKAITEEASLLKYFGVKVERVLYPLYPGEGRVGIGVLAGVLLTYYSAKSIKCKYKFNLLFLSIVPLWIILATDSRGALVSSLLSSGVYYVAHKYKLTFIRFASIAMPFLPLLLMFISLQAFQSGLNAEIAREGSADISSGRIIIWSIALMELIDFRPIHIIGFGSYGQAISGVSYDYMNMFSSWVSENPELFSLHNLAVQMVFDIGYIGLIVFIFLYYRLLTITIYSVDPKINILSSILIFIILAGVTDTAPLFYGNGIFIIFVFISTCILKYNFEKGGSQLAPPEI